MWGTDTGGTESRGGNRLRVVDALRRHGRLSRADIARHTGLSRSTVSALVAELERAGAVVEQAIGDEGGQRARGQGRPPILLALDASAGAALGIDFGHRHLRVALADLSSTVLAETRRELDVDRAAATALDAAAEMVREVVAAAGVDPSRLIGAGMGLPGPIDRASETVGSSVILPGWAGLRAGEEMAGRISVEVVVDNDANLGALAERSYGAARGESDLIYIKASSGIGAGLILGGRLHRGTSGIAGELGHVQVAADGAICRCGNRGCLESVAAAPALLAALRPTHGDDITLRELVELARSGDPGCRRVLGDAGRAIGRVAADLCNHLNPGMVVVGGDLAAAGPALLDGIRESIQRYALPAAAAAVSVVAATLGDRAEVLGALALVITDTNRSAAVLAPAEAISS